MSLVKTSESTYFVTVSAGKVIRKPLELPADKYFIYDKDVYHIQVVDECCWIMKNDIKYMYINVRFESIESFCIIGYYTYISFGGCIKVYYKEKICYYIPLKVKQLNVRTIKVNDEHQTYIYSDGVIYSFCKNGLVIYRILKDIQYFINLSEKYGKIYFTYIEDNKLFEHREGATMFHTYRTYNLKYTDEVESSGLINLRKNYSYSELGENELFHTNDHGVFGILDGQVYKICEENSVEFIGKRIYKDGIYSATSKRYIVVDNYMVELLGGEIPVW